MEKKLVIIDGSSLLYRAFYALPPTMTSPDGIPTNAVYGFLRMLLGLYRDLDPEYMAVTFDKDRHTFRTEMYEGYKATRKPAPDELVPQFDLIRDVMQVMGVAVYSLDGYEGDDILGTLSLRYEKEMPVNIVTGDRDALQLSSSRTTVFLTQKGITNMAAMTPEAVFEKYHIEPRQVIDMKALMGDTADNIPGVPGIGEKTALKLITQYDNLNNLYAHVEEIKGAQGKKLIANKELAYLSCDRRPSSATCRWRRLWKKCISPFILRKCVSFSKSSGSIFCSSSPVFRASVRWRKRSKRRAGPSL